MTPIEAIVKGSSDGYSRFRCAYEDGFLWSNGHIAVRGDYEGRELPTIAKTWDKNAARTDEHEAVLDRCIQGPYMHVYRALISGEMTVWVNEAYRVACWGDGVAAFITGPEQPIAFRKDGVLVGLVTPVRYKSDGDDVMVDTTDELVWGAFANEHNDFYAQSREAVKKKLVDAITKAQSERSDASSRKIEAESEILEYDQELQVLNKKLRALKRLEGAAVA